METSNNELEGFRKGINEIDSEIIKLLSDRFNLVKQVGIYKKEHNIKPLDPARWAEVLVSRKVLASSLGLNETFIEEVWNTIHEEALRLEER